MGLQRDGTKGCGVQGEPSFCGKLYIISVFYRQDSHLLLTFIETKILFLKSHNFIIWSRIHSTLSFDNYTYNELLPSSKVKAFSLGLQAVTELWLHTYLLLSSWSYPSSEICILSEAVGLSQYGCHVKMRQEGILSIPKTTHGNCSKQTTSGGSLHFPFDCQHVCHLHTH